MGAEEIGKTILNAFVQDRLMKKEMKFHDSLKQQKLKTFKTLYSVPILLDVETSGSCLESGREVDVDTLLQ